MLSFARICIVLPNIYRQLDITQKLPHLRFRSRMLWMNALFVVMLLSHTLTMANDSRLSHNFPRLMGMNIGAKNYEDPAYQTELAKLDVVILGFYRGWNNRKTNEPIRDVIKAIKQRNPRILLGQYTILNEAHEDVPRYVADQDKAQKLDAEGWWARDDRGQPVQWTSEYNAWDINFTERAKPDKNGDRYPQWLAKRDYHLYFEKIPELDIWYFDNVMYRPRVNADWDLDRDNDDKDTENIRVAFRKGHQAHWQAARRLAPNMLFVGNADNDLSYPAFLGQLNGAFLEGLMGLQWSIEAWGGWEKMMERYRAVMVNTAPPHIVGFNVHGSPRNYRFMRYALTSCLLDNGYFSFTDTEMGYSSVPWFDEYDVDLGDPIDPPSLRPWKSGVYRRVFTKGMVLVNPGWNGVTVAIEPGYRRLKGSQAPEVNNGQSATEITLDGKNGIILVRE